VTPSRLPAHHQLDDKSDLAYPCSVRTYVLGTFPQAQRLVLRRVERFSGPLYRFPIDAGWGNNMMGVVASPPPNT
jgi:hypothetical protein